MLYIFKGVVLVVKEMNKLFLQQLNAVEGTNYRGIVKWDMDDVLAQFDIGFLDHYNRIYNDHLKPKDMYDWDMSKYVKPECGEKIYDLLKIPGLFRYLQPVEHSQKVVQRLIDNNFLLLIVSDSPKGHSHCEMEGLKGNSANPADDKRMWLSEHFPMIPQDHVWFGSKKHFVLGGVLVDDKPATFEKHESLGLDAILIDRPYNQHIKTSYRAHNLLEAEEMIYTIFND